MQIVPDTFSTMWVLSVDEFPQYNSIFLIYFYLFGCIRE